MIPRSLRRSRPRGGRRALYGGPVPVRGRAGINRHADAVSCVAARRSRGMSALVIKNPRSRMTSFPCRLAVTPSRPPVLQGRAD
jgi:hypothetical protein